MRRVPRLLVLASLALVATLALASGSPSQAVDNRLAVGLAESRYEIFSMAEVGGVGVQLTEGPALNRYPAVSADGTRIAFQSSRDGDWEVYVANIDGSNPVRVTERPGFDGQPTWAPDGKRLAYISGRYEPGSYLQDLHVIDLETKVDTKLTPENAWDDTPAWSPDGSLIAVTSWTRDGHWNIHVMAPDGTGRRLVGAPSNSDDFFPTWSPDGLMLAFESDRSDRYQIWSSNLDGSVQTNLTNDDRTNGWPTWSKQGRIAYIRDGFQLMTMASDGTLKRMPDVDYDVTDPAWAPNGSLLHVRSDQSRYVLALGDAQSGVLTTLTGAGEDPFYPAWSPTHARLAFNQFVGGQSVLRVGKPGRAFQRVGLKKNNYWGSSWSPDGKQLAAAVVTAKDRRSGVSILTLGTRKERPLVSGLRAAFISDPDWSRRGVIAYVQQTGSRGEIRTVPARGGKPKILVPKLNDAWDPSWSPDGNRLAFTSYSGGNPEIWVKQGGRIRDLGLYPNLIAWSPAWSADGRRIAFVRYFGWGYSNVWIMNADGTNLQALLSSPAGVSEIEWY